MSRTGYKGLLASTALIGVMVVVSDGCSGDSGNNNGDAMSDAGMMDEAIHPPVRHDAAQTDDGGGGIEAAADGITFGDSGALGDGTTGKVCATDSDCVTPGGPMMNKCTNSNYFQLGPLNPTPVCVSPICDLGDGTVVMYCDGGGPTDSTSPGICMPAGSLMTGLNGQCLPRCTIPLDGTAPTGCQGKDRCNLFATGTDMRGNPIAIGFCLGGCAANSDCPSGSTCQTDQGICVTTVKPATKQLGQICTQNDLQPTRYGCNCFVTQMATIGYCSQFCITGPSSPAPCPSGYVCDPQLPAQVMGQNDASVQGFTKVNPGLAGYCLQSCSTTPAGDAGNPASGDAMAGDAATDAASMSGGGDAQGASMCPLSAGCDSQFTAGPDCVP